MCGCANVRVFQSGECTYRGVAGGGVGYQVVEVPTTGDEVWLITLSRLVLGTQAGISG